MFAIVQNGIIQLLIPAGSQFTWNGIDYPPNWVNLSSPEEKTAIGMVDVVYGQPANDQYYWVQQNDPVYNSQTNQVYITFTNTPKDLTSVKTNAFNTINNIAYSILFPSDWMVVKGIETSTPVNSDWNSWRATIRATADATRTAVTGAADVDAVAGIMANINWAKSPSALAAEAAQLEQSNGN